MSPGAGRRLHPGLLLHTTRIDGQRRLVAEASAARPPVVLNHPHGFNALAVLPRQFDRDLASRTWSAEAIPQAAHDLLWNTFEAAGLFADAADEPDSWWDTFGWREARAYHSATRDYPFLQMDRRAAFHADAERMNSYADEGPAPDIYQHFDGEAAIELPKASPQEGPQDRLADAAESAGPGRQSLATLLDVCFGERGRIAVADGSTCLLKSIPSGGARHPTELFIAVFDLPDVPAGIYHYDVERHRLDTVRGGQQREPFTGATLDLFHKLDTPPAAALVFTSLVERAMWRYRDPRSFRAVLVDVGHAVSAFRHVARLLGFRTYAYQKMNDQQIADLLRIDPIIQPPLYVATLVP